MKAKGQAPNPWMSRARHDQEVAALVARCVQAEECVAKLLHLITQDGGAYLAACGGDWQRATEELCQ